MIVEDPIRIIRQLARGENDLDLLDCIPQVTVCFEMQVESHLWIQSWYKFQAHSVIASADRFVDSALEGTSAAIVGTSWKSSRAEDPRRCKFAVCQEEEEAVVMMLLGP